MTFNSADAVPAGATVQMNIYADVLDANDDLAAWEAAYNPSTYLDDHLARQDLGLLRSGEL